MAADCAQHAATRLCLVGPSTSIHRACLCLCLCVCLCLVGPSTSEAYPTEAFAPLWAQEGVPISPLDLKNLDSTALSSTASTSARVSKRCFGAVTTNLPLQTTHGPIGDTRDNASTGSLPVQGPALLQPAPSLEEGGQRQLLLLLGGGTYWNMACAVLS